MNKICRVCQLEQPLREFFIFDQQTGARRHECRACALKRRKAYEAEGHTPRPRGPKPVNFRALFHRGTRCWCCRRDSRGEMLCRQCRTAA